MGSLEKSLNKTGKERRKRGGKTSWGRKKFITLPKPEGGGRINYEVIAYREPREKLRGTKTKKEGPGGKKKKVEP